MACIILKTLSHPTATYQARHSIAVYGICSGTDALASPSAAPKMNAAEHLEDCPRDDYSLEDERGDHKIICRRAINLR
jgi:hypothetical protein